MSRKPKPKTSPEPMRQAFTRTELTTMLNNAVAMASKPAGWEPHGVPERRLSALRQVATAMSETLKELQDEGYLRPEEAVFALLALALQYQMLYVNGSAVVPRSVISQKTLDALKALVAERSDG